MQPAPQALPTSQPCILASASSLNSMRPRSPPAPPPAPPCRSPVAYCMPAGCGAPRHRNIERRRGFLTAARRRPACAPGADGRLRIRKRRCRAVRAPSLLPIVPCKCADGLPHAPAATRVQPAEEGNAGVCGLCTFMHADGRPRPEPQTGRLHVGRLRTARRPAGGLSISRDVAVSRQGIFPVISVPKPRNCHP